MFGAVSRVTLSLAITIGGIVTACRHTVPSPTLPMAPEVSRRSPKPPTIDPAHRTDTESSEFGHASLRVADVPTDAGVSDVIDLPPVPDADTDLLRDAGQPL